MLRQRSRSRRRRRCDFRHGSGCVLALLAMKSSIAQVRPARQLSLKEGLAACCAVLANLQSARLRVERLRDARNEPPSFPRRGQPHRQAPSNVPPLTRSGAMRAEAVVAHHGLDHEP